MAHQRMLIEQFDARHRLHQMKVNAQEEMAPPPVMVEGQREREVERVINARFRKLGGNKADERDSAEVADKVEGTTTQPMANQGRSGRQVR
ncbi:hypothetical protein CYMTET_20325 [Cymbomonas tetramitiformis]|uniref:Uncharacterized protein n=1 Tax=Cymbomonas tetramitiformis TaxID=36881 RepID=A0AAE0G4A2_9CHLO|nr:hypothetical protein CYMTET_20325 [Cymbomonas tetramitiformis]